MFYVIMKAKVNLIWWTFHLNWIRAWLIVEITFFFNSIASGMIYLGVCCILPGGGTFLRKDTHQDSVGYDCYETKNTTDFLHYNSKEYFMYTF